MKGKRSARVARARLSLVRPIQGGTSGLINKLMAGRLDPLSPDPEEAVEPWQKYSRADQRARDLREYRREKAQAKRRAERPPF